MNSLLVVVGSRLRGVFTVILIRLTWGRRNNRSVVLVGGRIEDMTNSRLKCFIEIEKRPFILYALLSNSPSATNFIFSISPQNQISMFRCSVIHELNTARSDK